MKYITAKILLSLSFMFAAGQTSAVLITPTDDANTLISNILGTGITVLGSNYIDGANVSQSGTFTDGLASGLGFDAGIILTTGAASEASGPNISDGTTGITGSGGDADLNLIVAPNSTFDSAVLEFDFQFGDGTAGGDLYFTFQFASEEYNEYTNSAFNDVFALYVDGVNVALIPGTTTPVAINTVNGGNPLGTDASNPDLFNNNDPSDGGPFFNIEYDGFTDPFGAIALGLSTGAHTMKFAIADTSDQILDSAVFIQAGSFSSEPPTQVTEPGALVLMGTGLLAIGLARRRRKKTGSVRACSANT